MLRLLARLAAALVVGGLVYTAMAHAQEPASGTVVVQAAQESGLSAKGSDLTWPTAAAVTAWRLIDLGTKVVEQLRGAFDRWLDKTDGRVKVDLRSTTVSTHTENDPEPTRPIRVETATYQGPDRRGPGRKRLQAAPDPHDDEETPQ
jgi:hypothetical protein